MAKFTHILVLSTAVFVALAAAQKQEAQVTLCDCDVEAGMCDYAFETSPGFCKTDSTPCDFCKCITGGPMSCQVVPGGALVITNPANGACQMETTMYAECPASTPMPTATPTPVPQPAGGWFLSAQGESCDSICATNSLPCVPAPVQDLNSISVGSPSFLAAFVLSEFGHTCTSTPSDCPLCADYMPGIRPDSGECSFSSAQSASICATTAGKFQRVCCCGAEADCPVV
mmetsp:Transcript_14245/g.30684  ORF Transcript_14245/g.30684 Transcript_14245/m.30684 type:complete len:229 (-) Transcript_14245:300-986(-)